MSDMIRNRTLTLRSCAVRGPKGDTGAAGADGKDGTNGKDGKDAILYAIGPNELETGYESAKYTLAEILSAISQGDPVVLSFNPIGSSNIYYANIISDGATVAAYVPILIAPGSLGNSKWYYIYVANVGGTDTISVTEEQFRLVPATGIPEAGKVLMVSAQGKPVWADLPS